MCLQATFRCYGDVRSAWFNSARIYCALYTIMTIFAFDGRISFLEDRFRAATGKHVLNKGTIQEARHSSANFTDYVVIETYLAY